MARQKKSRRSKTKKRYVRRSPRNRKALEAVLDTAIGLICRIADEEDFQAIDARLERLRAFMEMRRRILAEWRKAKNEKKVYS